MQKPKLALYNLLCSLLDFDPSHSGLLQTADTYQPIYLTNHLLTMKVIALVASLLSLAAYASVFPSLPFLISFQSKLVV